MRRLIRFAFVAMSAVVACSKTSDPPVPVVTITSPEFEVHGSGAVVIQIVVGGCQAGAVELLVDGETLAVLVPPFQYTWDTTWAAEGRRVVTARASCGGAAGTSAPLAIWVDRTPPAVVDRDPADGASDPCVTDPIGVTFSEPVDLASAQGDIVVRYGGVVVPSTITSSDGGARLAIAPGAAPVAGDVVSIQIGTEVRDLAGLPLGAATSWSFSYPDVCDPVRGPLSSRDGSIPSAPSLAFDASGRPIVAWRPGEFLGAYRFAEDGAVLETIDAAAWGRHASVAVAPGATLVADDVWAGDSYDVRLQRLGSDAFSSAAPTIDGGALYEMDPQLTFTPAGTPVLVWTEAAAGTAGPQLVRAAFLDGGVWSDRGSVSLNVDPSAVAHSPAVTSEQGWPAAVFVEAGRVYLELAGWGSAFSMFYPSPVATSGDDPAVAFDGADPFVAVSEPGSGAILVYRIVRGAWAALPDPRRDPSRRANTPAIAIAAPGRPVVAWTEGSLSSFPYSAGSLYVSEWTGTAWTPLGGALNGGSEFPAYGPAVAVDGSGRVNVVWTEPVAPFADRVDWNVHLVRANR